MAAIKSAREWGEEQARLAPPWSDKQWREAMAIIGARVVESTEAKVARVESQD